MANHVFISYASKDKEIADSTCTALEAGGVTCWIAPRNILPGSDYGASIMEALETAQAIVLILSSHSNASPHIKREIERAVNKGVAVIPFRIEDVLPSKSLEYFISTQHWLDAFTPPLERHLQHLVETVGVLLGQGTPPPEVKDVRPVQPPPVEVAVPLPDVRPGPAPSRPPMPPTVPKQATNPALVVVPLVVGVLLLVVIIGGVYWWKNRPSADLPLAQHQTSPGVQTKTKEAPPVSPANEYLERAKTASLPEEKIQWLTKALEVQPNQPEIYFKRGLAYGEKKAYEAAVADYSKAIALNPQYASAYNNRGNLYQAQGDLDKALEDFNKALALDPKYALAYLNRGSLYQKKGLYDQAIRDYEKAVALAPDLAEIYLNRGLAMQARQDQAQALADFDKALSLKPDFPLAFFGRGYLYLSQGDYDRALKDLDRALALDPKNARGFQHRGQAYELKGDLTRAQADFKMARTLDPRLAR